MRLELQVACQCQEMINTSLAYWFSFETWSTILQPMFDAFIMIWESITEVVCKVQEFQHFWETAILPWFNFEKVERNWQRICKTELKAGNLVLVGWIVGVLNKIHRRF